MKERRKKATARDVAWGISVRARTTRLITQDVEVGFDLGWVGSYTALAAN